MKNIWCSLRYKFVIHFNHCDHFMAKSVFYINIGQIMPRNAIWENNALLYRCSIRTNKNMNIPKIRVIGYRHSYCLILFQFIYLFIYYYYNIIFFCCKHVSNISPLLGTLNYVSKGNRDINQSSILDSLPRKSKRLFIEYLNTDCL